MLIVLLFIIFSVISFAETINISLKNHNGESYYTVDSADSRNLKSKLNFPFDFTSVDLEYKHDYSLFNITFSSSFLVDSKTTTGNDYDWKDKDITVFSSSKNHIDKYYALGLSLSKKLSKETEFFSGVYYKVLNMNWSDTYQKDYVKNEQEYISNKSLEYQQSFYEYILGVSYQSLFLKDILVELKPSLIYTVVDIKDKHLLRGFYTTQNVNTFGYNIALKSSYNIGENSTIALLFSYKTVKKSRIDMNYYNQLHENYLTLPSSYAYKNIIRNISYNYSF